MTTDTMHAPAFSAKHANGLDAGMPSPSVWVPSCRSVAAGRMASAVAVAFLIFDVSLKLLQLPAALEVSTQLGFAAESVFTIGMIEVLCLITYLVPRTRVFGAILWTGYLGGAIVTHLRLGHPLLSHTLFPIYVALLLWAQPWVSDGRLRALLLSAPGGSLPDAPQTGPRE